LSSQRRLNASRVAADYIPVRSRLLVILLAATALTASAASAEASTGRCLGDGTGPMCQFWTAKAVSINDGDTIGVDVDGDGNHREYQVRFLGLQAMELTRHSDSPSKQRGECHAIEATRRVRQLLRRSHWRVRLSAQHASSRSGGRLARYVGVRVQGHWRDLGEILMTEGKTIFMGSGTEPAWNHRYNLAGQQAALRHIGMWNTTHCGSGPSQDVPLRVWADWDPPGPDQQNINGEWIKVQNLSTTTSLPLGGWWVRDSMLRRFTFPRETVLAPGEIATVHTGRGTAAGNTFFWGLGITLFPNVDGVDLGDGAYLSDPKGDLRQWMVYPCLAGCTDPGQGAVQVVAQPRGSDEAVWVRNVSDGPVDLSPYVLMVPGSLIPFDPGTVLAPGDRIKVPVPGGRILPDSGGNVRLSTWSLITIACDAWGSGRC
jgi:endonuclease YncB( thermonuclease family)